MIFNAVMYYDKILYIFYSLETSQFFINIFGKYIQRFNLFVYKFLNN